MHLKQNTIGKSNRHRFENVNLVDSWSCVCLLRRSHLNSWLNLRKPGSTMLRGICTQAADMRSPTSSLMDTPPWTSPLQPVSSCCSPNSPVKRTCVIKQVLLQLNTNLSQVVKSLCLHVGLAAGRTNRLVLASPRLVQESGGMSAQS